MKLNKVLTLNQWIILNFVSEFLEMQISKNRTDQAVLIIQF